MIYTIIISLLIEKPFYLLRPQSFSFQIVSEFIDTFVKFSNFVPGVGLLTPCFVPRGGFLYRMIVPGGGFCFLQVVSWGGWFWVKLIPALSLVFQVSWGIFQYAFPSVTMLVSHPELTSHFQHCFYLVNR